MDLRTCLILVTLVVGAVSSTSAQTLIWTDNFEKGVSTTESCARWRAFLTELEGKSFASVTMSGSRDMVGKTISDPAAATELARLLSTGTPGVVVSDGHRWVVTLCTTTCGTPDMPYGVALSYEGDESACKCSDRYSIRPETPEGDWGGINVPESCGADRQTMTLEFNSGVKIVANGSTTLCEGSSVELVAVSSLCMEPLTYLWSNGATTPSITVSEPGSYSVTVSGPGCSGISQTVEVTESDVAVEASGDAVYCDEPVQLNAIGTSSHESSLAVNTICVFNAPNILGQQDDCAFLVNACFDGATPIGYAQYTANVNDANPLELRYNIYYIPYAVATFRFKLNGHELGSFVEGTPTAFCENPGGSRYPRSFPFLPSQFKPYWIEGGSNELRVEVETAANGIHLAGITIDVVTSNVFYAWSPTDGLNSASIQNPLAAPSVSTEYVVTYTDPNGCSATDIFKVDVDCGEDPPQPPVAVCKEVTIELEEGCEAFVDASAFDGGSTSPSGSALTFTVSPEGPYPVGETEVELTVTDAEGSSTCTTKVVVIDPLPPVIIAPADLVVANDAGACSARVLLEAPEATDNCAIETIVHDQPDDIFPVGETMVTWTVTDVHGNAQSVAQKVIVTNADPVINSVQASADIVATGKLIKLATSITDNNARTATIDWGDGSAPSTVNSPSDVFEVSHSYGYAGFYDITITVTDHCDASVSYAYEDVIVYDHGASVRGDGWFESERGFYLKDPRAAGKAQFHFDAEYKKSSSQPSGSVSLKFKEGKLEFKSTQLEWFIVQDNRATLFASGKVNGSKNYTILIAAVDEDDNDDQGKPDPKGHDDDHKPDKPGKPKEHDPHGKANDPKPSIKDKKKKEIDKIRVQISDPTGKVIYDTQWGEPGDAIARMDIGGGSIDIKRSKNKTFDDVFEDIFEHFGWETASVYPNPFTDWLTVKFHSDGRHDVIVQLVDLSGRVLASGVFRVSEDGKYTLDVPKNVREGIYLLMIKQGKRVEYVRAVRK